MKQKLIAATLMLYVIVACSPKKQEAQAPVSDIPEILQNHSEKELFTKLTDGNAEMIPLFNGKNLSGWYIFTQKYGENNDVENQFMVEDGVLHLQGQPMGYICTTDTYKNYYLKVVFRWGEKKYPPREDHARDSGVQYHIGDTVRNTLWPMSVECQIQENDCGDYWFLGGTSGKSPNRNPQDGITDQARRTANYENPAPEWNTVEIICYDDKSEHYVNGHLVNQAYEMNVSEGKILLQLEGAEIYYKTVDLLPLK